MIDDIRVGLRTVPGMPGFSLAFILTLGLGIGANTAIFRVINGVLLRPPPYPDAHRIVHLRQAQTAAGRVVQKPDRRHNRALSDGGLDFRSGGPGSR